MLGNLEEENAKGIILFWKKLYFLKFFIFLKNSFVTLNWDDLMGYFLFAIDGSFTIYKKSY